MNVQTPQSPDEAPDAAPMHPDLAALLAGGAPSDAAIDAFLMGRDLPLSQPGALTFLWRGDAIHVEILRWIRAGVDRAPFTRIPDSDLWMLHLPVEDNGRFEYKLNIVRAGGEEWVLDPLNPNRAGDPFGENSVAMTFGYQRPAWSVANGAPKGHVEGLEVESAVFGEARREQVYVPPGYVATGVYPLVIFHDGGDYATYADLRVSLDNLIDAGDIPPLIAVLVQAGDRMSEYPRSRRHARYVVHELLPAIEDRYAIDPDPRHRVLLGASLGAVASLSTAFRYPGTFGGLILKSGTFILDASLLKHREHPVFRKTARLVEAMKRAPALPETRAFVSTGELEGLATQNRAMADFLESHGVSVKFQSSWDGHHWHNWRDQLRDALMWVLTEGPDRND